jgi:hypothetical protein
MSLRLTSVLLVFCLGFTVAPAQSVSKAEVLAAIAVLEKSVLSPEAGAAAATVTRFGEESEEVMITLGQETLPWVQGTSGPDASTRALLMAVYFAGNIKSQLAKHRPEDDPYSGWLAVIKAYQEIRSKRPRLQIPEIEELIAKEKAGTLKKDADALRKRDETKRQDLV